MAFKLIDDGEYHTVNKETVPWLLKRGELSDATNLIFDRPGIARQRGPTTALVSGAQTAYATMPGFCHSQDGGSTIEELYGYNGSDGNVYVVNKVTGAATLVGTAPSSATVGRPVRHFGFVLWPITVPTGISRRIIAVAGVTSSVTFSNSVAFNVVAGQQQITLGGANVTTNMRVGHIVQISDFTTSVYLGRVVSIDSATKFTVWPKPTVSFTAAAASGLVSDSVPGTSRQGGACAASFQNRLLVGNTTDYSSTGQTLVTDRRIYYSVLPTETGIQLGGALIYYGAVFLQPSSSPEKNYIELPAGGPIVAMEPVNDSELLILTTDGAWLFRGDLATQSATFAPGVTFDLFPLNTNAGCLSDLSVQRTPHGIVWASSEGLMIYRGNGRIDDLTKDKYQRVWRQTVTTSTFVLHGSSFVASSYILSYGLGGSSLALSVDVNTESWAPLLNTDWFYGLARPTNSSQVFALRWWDQAGAAPSMTNGQMIRAETIFRADADGQTKLDADGSTVGVSGVTRTLTDDAQTDRLLRQIAVRYQAAHAGGANLLSVGVSSRIDATDTAGAEVISVGSLSNTQVLTITGQSNATPIVITTSVNHGLQSEDEVDIHACTPNTNANGHWRITVLSATTFSLNGSSGNGATSATGDAKKVSDQTYVGAGADMGPGNIVYFNYSGAINRFELHGIRVSVMEFGRGLGRAS